MNYKSGVCTCGHSEDLHGCDSDFPGSSACREKDCTCIAYEEDE